jgi:transposase
MGFIQGEGRTQGTLFPVTLDELIPQDHVCRVIDAFVDRLGMAEFGFERAEPGETGRPGYDPRDLLKLYLYGYLQRVRSSRRLENECRRNVEVMWLLNRLSPDHKSIAEFRRIHSEAVTQVGVELIRFARSLGTLLREKKFKESQVESLAGYDVLIKQTSPSTSFLNAARKDLAAAYDGLNQPDKAVRFRAELANPENKPAPVISQK